MRRLKLSRILVLALIATLPGNGLAALVMPTHALAASPVISTAGHEHGASAPAKPLDCAAACVSAAACTVTILSKPASVVAVSEAPRAAALIRESSSIPESNTPLLESPPPRL